MSECTTMTWYLIGIRFLFDLAVEHLLRKSQITHYGSEPPPALSKRDTPYRDSYSAALNRIAVLEHENQRLKTELGRCISHSCPHACCGTYCSTKK